MGYGGFFLFFTVIIDYNNDDIKLKHNPCCEENTCRVRPLSCGGL